MDRMSALFLSPGNRLVVVFGGGPVALRKCRHFDGFRIKAVALDILPEIEELAEETVIADVSGDVTKHFEGADIIVAATNSKEINGRIRDSAKSLGIPVNSAHGGGDLLIPSVLRRDNYVVAVSSEGKVPAFPPYVIAELEKFLDGRFDLMMELLMFLRPISYGKLPTQKERAEYLAGVIADKQIREMLDKGDIERAKTLALELGGLN